MSLIEKVNSRKTSTYIFATIGAIFLAIILLNQFANNPSTYKLKLEQERDNKDLMLKNDPDSPIPKAEKATFEGLRYFSINEAYRVPATLTQDAPEDTLTLMTSTGSDYQVVTAGKLQFTLQNQTHQLSAYTYLEAGKSGYFVPFTDLTSGVSTYGGGRYLDVPTGNELIIDFNTAYNPYCAYNADFVCPLPPAENHLQVEIRSGELEYQ